MLALDCKAASAPFCSITAPPRCQGASSVPWKLPDSPQLTTMAQMLRHAGEEGILEIARLFQKFNKPCKKKHCCDCSVTKSCPASWDPTGCSMPGVPALPVSWGLLRLTSTESMIPSNYPAISSFVTPLSSCPQFLPASGSFPKKAVLPHILEIRN